MQIELVKIQELLDWVKTKLYLDGISPSASKRYVKRGQVYSCYFGIGIGNEIQKLRPCVILQNNIGNSKSGNVIVAPITHTNKNIPSVALIQPQYNSNGTTLLDGYVNTSNILCVSKARLKDQITTLTTTDMKAVDKSMASSLDLLHYLATSESILNDKLLYIEKLLKQRDTYKIEIEELLNLSKCKDMNELRKFLKGTRQS